MQIRGDRMYFHKKMERSCAYCKLSTVLNDDQVLCMKKGVCSADNNCRKFEYDPFKRIPKKPKAVDFSKYDDQDYGL